MVTVRETGWEWLLEPVGEEDDTYNGLSGQWPCAAMPRVRRLYSRYSLDILKDHVKIELYSRKHVTRYILPCWHISPHPTEYCVSCGGQKHHLLEHTQHVLSLSIALPIQHSAVNAMMRQFTFVSQSVLIRKGLFSVHKRNFRIL